MTTQMVSIIMPTWNRAHLITESIQSVLRQSYINLELIIVDDGSEDGTETVVKQVTDNRIRYYRLPHTGYISRNRNFGIQQSKGRYLAFMDSDDLWKENKLEQQVQLLKEHAAIGFSITGATDFRDDKIVAENIYPGKSGMTCTSVFAPMVSNRFVIYTPTLVMRRECLDRVGLLDESMQWSADYQFSLRLAYHYPAGIIYDSLMWRRLHDNNRSDLRSAENYGGYITTFEYLYRHRMVSAQTLRKIKSYACYKMGELHQQKGEPSKARNRFLQSLRHQPLQPRCLRRLLETYR